MTTKKRRVPMEEDVLSRLPEQILDIILCFLPQKEAVRTCVLSKSWRHLGPSRSKLELCHVTDFNGYRKRFKSVLYDTLKRYNSESLFLKQLTLIMAPSRESPMRLDLYWITSKAQLLEELYLERFDLQHINWRPMLNHLRKLSLVGCNISEESLEMLLSSTTCPLLEWLCINDSFGFENFNVGNALRLKHFEISHYRDLSSIQVDVPTLETISIANCLHWRFLDDHNYFPRLKSVCLTMVSLSSETFGFFASKYMPSLEKLELDRCYGCDEFQLSSSSIKYLSIIGFSGEIKAAIIDAPNLSCFNLKAYHPLPSLSFTPISREWKSHVHLTTDICFDRYDRTTPCLGIHEIHRVLETLSESQISLKLSLSKEYQRLILDDAHGGLYQDEPHVVEDLSLELGKYSFYTVQSMFDYLFRVCRPRYIYNAHIKNMSKDITAGILWKLLLHEREKIVYWNQDLVEVSMESSSNYMNHPKEWQSVPGNSLSECHNQNIRFRLKWRGK